MKFKPHKYQEISINAILENKRYALFLDCGLGKTVCTLQALDELLYNRFEISKVLVIAPLRVADHTWSDEIKKWGHLSHLRVSKILGSKEKRLKALDRDADIYVINRENVVWLVNHFGIAFPFDCIVVDESSSFKDASSKRFKALRKVASLTKRIILLTATPASKNIENLWSQIYLLDKGERLEKSLTAFRRKYLIPLSYKGHVVYRYGVKEGAEQTIYNKLKDVALSLNAKDWLDVPKLNNIYHQLEFPEKVQQDYHNFASKLIYEYENGEIVADNKGVLLGKLLQFCNGAIYTDEGYEVIHDTKLVALQDIIEAANGKSVMIFYQFKHDKERIYQLFKDDYEISFLDNNEDIQKWNDKKIDIALVHPASMGYGLNLQAGGNILVWFGLSWSLEQYQQAVARLHRQGQQEVVLNHHLVVSSSVDEDVIKSLQNKKVSQDALLEAVRYRLKGVSHEAY